jgi:hypothetical protein
MVSSVCSGLKSLLNSFLRKEEGDDFAVDVTLRRLMDQAEPLIDDYAMFRGSA